MKVSDYIVEYMIKEGITDVFGYPGGMVTHLLDSFFKYSDRIKAHVTYHEQGAAFAACGYAQTSGKPGVAYATSGPGATNLITGICNAYFDSIPVVFITGQVNTNEAKGAYGVRQRGFQETDIVTMVKSVTKYSCYVDNPNEIPRYLKKAFSLATSGRKGPVLLDIPMDIFRAEIDPHFDLPNQLAITPLDAINTANIVKEELEKAESPCFLIGGGVKSAFCEEHFRLIAKKYNIPVLSSMIAFDVMKSDPLYFGFIGAYGVRTANFVAAKSDLIIAIGTRLDIRQVGINREEFAPKAKIIRFDIDQGELSYPVHSDEIQCCTDIQYVCDMLDNICINKTYSPWLEKCKKIRALLSEVDNNFSSRLIKKISDEIPDKTIITTDVGQNQVWVAQSFNVKPDQKILFSGGHGAMGYSLPASIGAFYGSGGKQVFCITGDGGLQMNIQELQFIAREKLPITTIVLNNNALGMIRHFQEMYFDGRYVQTKPQGGYTAPDLSSIANAYGIQSEKIDLCSFLKTPICLSKKEPRFIEILINRDTYVIPKLEFGKPNQDQEPLLDRTLYNELMRL